MCIEITDRGILPVVSPEENINRVCASPELATWQLLYTVPGVADGKQACSWCGDSKANHFRFIEKQKRYSR
jgi:hypothetical protein